MAKPSNTNKGPHTHATDARIMLSVAQMLLACIAGLAQTFGPPQQPCARACPPGTCEATLIHGPQKLRSEFLAGLTRLIKMGGRGGSQLVLIYSSRVDWLPFWLLFQSHPKGSLTVQFGHTPSKMASCCLQIGDLDSAKQAISLGFPSERPQKGLKTNTHFGAAAGPPRDV